jgi:integrase/recombinase XerC
LTVPTQAVTQAIAGVVAAGRSSRGPTPRNFNPGANMPLDEAMNDYLTHLTLERGCSAWTVKSCRNAISQAIAYFRQRLDDPRAGPDRLQPGHLRGWLDWLGGQGYAAATVRRRVATVRSWLRFLCRRHALAANPADGLCGPRPEKKPPHWLSVAEVDRLLACPDRCTARGRRDRAILETLFSAGLRVRELTGLDLADVDLDGGTALVRGKGRKERIALLGPAAQEAIRACLAPGRPATGEPALFLNREGGRLRAWGVYRLVKRYAAQAGLDPRTTPHTLRRSFAAALLERDCDLRTIQELLGHSNLSATVHYTIVSPGRLFEVYRRAHPRA